MREPTTTSIAMAAKRSNRVILTKEQCVQAKQARMDHARRFNEAIQDAQTIIGELIDKISLEFNLSLDHVAEKLHLGGHALKQRRGPGINNAYAHCLARCKQECTCALLTLYCWLTLPHQGHMMR